MPKAYEEAGVSVEAGYEVVKRIKSHVARTNRPGVVGGIGGFGGLFDLASLGYKERVRNRCSSWITSPAARTIRLCSSRSSPAWPTAACRPVPV